nr:MAG TPA: hypothetical protein [Caudoviricetes sp.]DAS93824.1 MAG TPA: hypothetical protein [Caudoviricetes sp.]DAY10836.1 MAG TPA: hypothetical protein [Caudoviricetes sp.]
MRNKAYIVKIRCTINNVRNRFFVEFFLITLIYVCFSTPENWAIIKLIQSEEITLKFDIVLYTGIMLILSMPYFMFNFLAIQKLNNDIFDKVNQEI